MKLRAATPSLAGMQLERWGGGRAGSARLPITGGGGGGGGGGLLEEVRREVVELRLPAAGDPETRSAPSPAAPSGAAPVPALAAPRARSLVQPEPWGWSRSEHHGAGGLVWLGAPPRPPVPRSLGHPRWVWHGEDAGRCGCAHGRPGPRGPGSSTTGRSGTMGDLGCGRRGPEGIGAAGDGAVTGRTTLEVGTGLRRPQRRFPGREAPGTPRGKFSESFPPEGVRSAVRACACFPPFRAPSRFLKALPVGSLRLRTGLGRMPSGSPLPCPSPSPPPSGPLGLVSYSSFLRGRGGGGGGESNRSC